MDVTGKHLGVEVSMTHLYSVTLYFSYDGTPGAPGLRVCCTVGWLLFIQRSMFRASRVILDVSVLRELQVARVSLSLSDS